jgi:hypothetical protein
MAGRYNNAGTVREEVRPYKLAGRHWPVTQLHKEEKTSSEKNTSEVREEPATVDLARPKQ